MKFSPSTFVKAAAAAVALAAAGAASAHGNVSFAIGANIAPGVSIGVSNAPYYGGYYAAPVYAPAPVYVAPQPVYYSSPVVYYETVPGFAPVFINGGYWWGGHRYYRTGGHWMRWQGGHAGYYGHARHWR